MVTSSIITNFANIKSHSKNNEPPQLNGLVATAFIAITVCIMAYSPLVGPASIIFLYVLWMPYAFIHGGRRLRHSFKSNLAPIFYIVFCIISVLWSDYRSVTARASVEAASMVICAVTIPQVVSIRSFIQGLNLGISIVLIATLISNNYGSDLFSGTYSLVGLFGSKNQVGLYSEIGILGSLIYLFSNNNIWKKLLFVLIPFGISLICLYLCKSATSTASLAFVLATIFGFRILIRLPKNFRKLAIATTIFVACLTVIIVLEFNLQDIAFSLFGKDSTLTGRTYLWSEGLKKAIQNPIIGTGFAAFWVPGQPLAERYWFEFGIFNRTGFHFHNTFIEVFVELGFIGLLLFTAMYILNTFRSISYVFAHGLNVTGLFCLTIMIMLDLRAFVEVDVFGAFGIGELLFFTIIPYLVKNPVTRADENLGYTPKFELNRTIV